MVKILSNGDIVPDNDPRASGGSSRPRTEPRQRQGFVQHETGQQQYPGGQQVSIFDVLNQKLLDLGIPRWNLGQYTVEPIASVGCLVAFLFFGLAGLIFAAVLFFVVKWSQQNSGTQTNPGNQPRHSTWGGGAGHRLGD